MGSFGPALILIAMTVYIFGVAFMQGIVTYLDDLDDLSDVGTRDHLEQYFGSSSDSFWTLFASISGGYDWAEVAKPLELLGPLYSGLFLLFVMFTSFCLLNILTAIFVTCAHQASSMNREIATDSAISDKRAFEGQLCSLFYEVDINSDGALSLEEFHVLLQDERNAVFLGAMGLDLHNIERFFEVVDSDGSGALDIIEFVDVCGSMRGEAKILHVRLLQDDLRQLKQQLTDLQALVISNIAFSSDDRVKGPQE